MIKLITNVAMSAGDTIDLHIAPRSDLALRHWDGVFNVLEREVDSKIAYNVVTVDGVEAVTDSITLSLYMKEWIPYGP